MSEQSQVKVKSRAEGASRVVSLVLAIVAILFLAAPVVTFILGVTALIVGIVSTRNANKEGRKPGMASAGITIAVIAIVLPLLYAVTTVSYSGIQERAREAQQVQQ